MLWDAEKNRTAVFTESLVDEEGNAVSIASSDTVYVKIGRRNEVPVLEFNSTNAAAGGSSVTKANPTTVVLRQDDMDFGPGVFQVEIGIVDDSLGDTFRDIAHGSLSVQLSQLGDDSESEL